jgi:lipopolysaccharide transport protein LptA
MKTALLCLLVLLFAACPSRAAEAKPAGQPAIKPGGASTGTNTLLIVCDNGMEFTNGRVAYRGNVQVLDGDMSLNCELLTIYFPTNFGSLDLIVAETNVFITQKDSLAVADRVVYNATNEVVTLTGNVILDTPQATLAGEVVTYNRKTGQGRIEARVVNMISIGAGAKFMGSNVFSIPVPGNKPATK